MASVVGWEMYVCFWLFVCVRALVLAFIFEEREKEKEKEQQRERIFI